MPNHKFGAISNWPDVFQKWYWHTRAYLNWSVEGSSLRVETVISGKSASEVFGLVLTLGARLVDFCLAHELVVTSNKQWPFRVNYLIQTLEEMRVRVESYVAGHVNVEVNSQLKIVYDCY